jgi:hypothetical protein
MEYSINPSAVADWLAVLRLYAPVSPLPAFGSCYLINQ